LTICNFMVISFTQERALLRREGIERAIGRPDAAALRDTPQNRDQPINDARLD
jgi:hypothetical protein